MILNYILKDSRNALQAEISFATKLPLILRKVIVEYYTSLHDFKTKPFVCLIPPRRLLLAKGPKEAEAVTSYTFKEKVNITRNNINYKIRCQITISGEKIKIIYNYKQSGWGCNGGKEFQLKNFMQFLRNESTISVICEFDMDEMVDKKITRKIYNTLSKVQNL